MRRLSEAAAIAQLDWLQDPGKPRGYGWTGYSPVGDWPAEVWVLNAIYERPDLPSVLTHDEVNRIEIDAGERDPTVVNGVDLDHSLTCTGMALGFQRRPGPEWRRLTWRQVGARDGFEFCAAQGEWPNLQYTVDPVTIPAGGWPRIFAPRSSWPANMEPPPEGSLEDESLLAVIDVLAAHTPAALAADCIAYVGPTYDETVCYVGDLRDLPAMVDDPEAAGDAPLWCSPSNLWSADRSWFVYTDYDLHATRIAGPAELIAALCADDRLDTVRGAGATAD